MGHPPEKPEPFEGIRTAGMLAMIPLLLIIAPLLGAYIGRWLDGRFGTTPWLLIVGLVLGFAAAGREIYSIYQRVQSDEERKKKRAP